MHDLSEPRKPSVLLSYEPIQTELEWYIKQRPPSGAPDQPKPRAEDDGLRRQGVALKSAIVRNKNALQEHTKKHDDFVTFAAHILFKSDQQYEFVVETFKHLVACIAAVEMTTAFVVASEDRPPDSSRYTPSVASRGNASLVYVQTRWIRIRKQKATGDVLELSSKLTGCEASEGFAEFNTVFKDYLSFNEKTVESEVGDNFPGLTVVSGTGQPDVDKDIIEVSSLLELGIVQMITAYMVGCMTSANATAVGNNVHAYLAALKNSFLHCISEIRYNHSNATLRTLALQGTPPVARDDLPKHPFVAVVLDAADLLAPSLANDVRYHNEVDESVQYAQPPTGRANSFDSRHTPPIETTLERMQRMFNNLVSARTDDSGSSSSSVNKVLRTTSSQSLPPASKTKTLCASCGLPGSNSIHNQQFPYVVRLR